MTPLFEARKLSKRFGDAVVLEDVNLAFAPGRLGGIMGPNGAGKTTCFNCLTGRYRPDRGEVWFAGENITGLAPREIARRGIARSFQIMNLFDETSALENVLVALPGLRAHETQDGAQQHRLAHAGRSHDGEDLTAADVDIEVLQHGRAAEGDGEAVHLDDRLAVLHRHQKSMPA